MEPLFKGGVDIIEASNQDVWRNWLKDNHLSQKSVWLRIFKVASGIPSVTYDQAVDEALCFGWIDSKPNKWDDKSHIQFFAKRNPKSNWSGINKAKVEKLIALGKMSDEGFRMIEIAKKSGAWDALNEVENLIIPTDLQLELQKYSDAYAYFSNFPKSTRRGILEWISNAKQPETRSKRIEETARLAENNIRANQYQSKAK
ncbi:MAG: YdeI/OmpD-associated family protein [Bacteroidota bacterium]|nr:YdeI/OmpD-associated family protein [Bacteroidota bacterium]